MKNINSPTLILSLDFELLWGMRDAHNTADYGTNVLGGRAAIPTMLNLFQYHDIHATWAAVGFMFAETTDQLRAYFPDESALPAYENSKLSPYPAMSEIASSDLAYWFAPELIRQIAETPGQEIGSHTFSHYYCRETGQTVAQFEADMLAAKRIAEDKGYNLTSVVLPRNQCEPEYTAVLAKLGFTAYRDEENDWIHEKIRFRPLMRILRLMDVYIPLTGQGGYIPQIENGIVNLVGSRMYKPYFKPLAFMERLKIRRIKKQMLHAAKNGLTFHLWWHPHNIGVRTEFHLKQIEEILDYYEILKEKYGMRSLNMREATQEVLDR
ncbi:MAG: polysaccharide deacetylase family protein [Clostridia bacterium]|nr:polysaccharide deacetylase family protein [Clostridia bacterium]